MIVKPQHNPTRTLIDSNRWDHRDRSHPATFFQAYQLLSLIALVNRKPNLAVNRTRNPDEKKKKLSQNYVIDNGCFFSQLKHFLHATNSNNKDKENNCEKYYNKRNNCEKKIIEKNFLLLSCEIIP